MKFLFQNNLLAEQWLAQTRKIGQNYPTVFANCIPFEKDFETSEPIVGLDYIPYGSVNMTNICIEKGFKGVAFNEDFAYSQYSKNTNTLNSGKIYTTHEALKFFEENDGHWFCKPNKDDKKWTGAVEHSERHRRMIEDMYRFKDSPGTYGIDDDFEVIISEPKEIQMEVRWFVVGGRIIDGSMYRFKNILQKENVGDDVEMVKEAQDFADHWLPHDNVVMDLALTESGLSVVEYNCINSSGFYENRAELIFNELWRYYEKK